MVLIVYASTLLQWYSMLYTSIYTYWYIFTLLQWYILVYTYICTGTLLHCKKDKKCLSVRAKEGVI